MKPHRHSVLFVFLFLYFSSSAPAASPWSGGGNLSSIGDDPSGGGPAVSQSIDDMVEMREGGYAPFPESEPADPDSLLMPASGLPAVQVDLPEPAPNPFLAPSIQREVINLWQYDSRVKHQGKLGTCTSFATVAGMENLYAQLMRPTAPNTPELNLSEWHLWNLQGKASNTSAAITAALGNFIVPETVLPYRAAAPTAPLADNGWVKLAGANWNDPFRRYSQIRQAFLAGHPVLLDVDTNQSWDDTNSGIVTSRGGLIRGKHYYHAVLGVGMVRTVRGYYYIVFKNSWGGSWGNQGYGYLPMGYCRVFECAAVELTGVILSPNVPCPNGMIRNATGVCQCPAGTVLSGGACVPVPTPIPCPMGMVSGPAGACQCPVGMVLTAGICQPPPTPVPCPMGMVRGPAGTCQCPPLMVPRPGGCGMP